MSAPRSPLLFLLACALLPSAARADDVGDILAQAKKTSADVAAPAGAPKTAAKPASCSDGIWSSRKGIFCENVADCRKFCSCACVFDEKKWKDVKNDGSTTCPGAPTSGPGMLPPDSPDLTVLPKFRYITHSSGAKAAAPALEGLLRLDDQLTASADRQKYGYTVRVVGCYRPAIEDSEPECGFVLKGMYMLARVTSDSDKKYWESKSDPNNLGLTWPGRTPHSEGYACDLILVDSKGQDSFDSRAGVDGAPASSIDQRKASRMLDAEVTNDFVGGSRLTFEAWHYEWTDNTTSRCKDPDCAENYWPVKGRP
jgi:hypothetical protein